MTNIKHHGIKGMRWGVRRKRGPSGRVSSDYSTSRKLAKKSVSTLSNEELKTLTNRLNLEKSYASLNPNLTAQGAAAANRALKNYGNAVVAGVTAAAATATVAAIIKTAGKVKS